MKDLRHSDKKADPQSKPLQFYCPQKNKRADREFDFIHIKV